MIRNFEKWKLSKWAGIAPSCRKWNKLPVTPRYFFSILNILEVTVFFFLEPNLDQGWSMVGPTLVGSMLDSGYIAWGCWANVGSMLDTRYLAKWCWTNAGSILDTRYLVKWCWTNAGSILDTGYIAQGGWTNLGSILDTGYIVQGGWTNVGPILDTVYTVCEGWPNVGPTLDTSIQHPAQHPALAQGWTNL